MDNDCLHLQNHKSEVPIATEQLARLPIIIIINHADFTVFSGTAGVCTGQGAAGASGTAKQAGKGGLWRGGGGEERSGRATERWGFDATGMRKDETEKVEINSRVAYKPFFSTFHRIFDALSLSIIFTLFSSSRSNVKPQVIIPNITHASGLCRTCV